MRVASIRNSPLEYVCIFDALYAESVGQRDYKIRHRWYVLHAFCIGNGVGMNRPRGPSFTLWASLALLALCPTLSHYAQRALWACLANFPLCPWFALLALWPCWPLRANYKGCG